MDKESPWVNCPLCGNKTRVKIFERLIAVSQIGKRWRTSRFAEHGTLSIIARNSFLRFVMGE